MNRLTADQISLEWLEEATVDNLKDAMRAGGDVLAAVNALLLTPEGKKIAFEMLNDPDYKPKSQRPVDPEEQAQIEADQARAAQQAAEAEAAAQAQAELEAQTQVQTIVADTSAEDTEALSHGITVTRDAQGRIAKLVKDYQATDEDGRPIGRPTHLEAKSWSELSAKETAAHVNAVRYAERIKSNRFKQSASAMNVVERGAAAKQASERSAQLAEQAVNEKDPEKMKQAVKESVAAERQAQEAEEAARQHGKIVAETWMADHVEDFVPCKASSSIMGDYLKANNLSMTYDNLEKAFKAVKNQLPKPEVDAASAPSANNTPTVATETNPVVPASIPPAAAPVAATTPVSQPQASPQASATAPTSTPVTANQPTVTRKPVVNGGLQPGTLSAARPEVVVKSPQETRSELLRQISKMSATEYRKKLNTDAKFVEKLKAAGIPVVGK